MGKKVVQLPQYNNTDSTPLTVIGDSNGLAYKNDARPNWSETDTKSSRFILNKPQQAASLWKRLTSSGGSTYSNFIGATGKTILTIFLEGLLLDIQDYSYDNNTDELVFNTSVKAGSLIQVNYY